jgi:hypothetical protein
MGHEGNVPRAIRRVNEYPAWKSVFADLEVMLVSRDWELKKMILLSIIPPFTLFFLVPLPLDQDWVNFSSRSTCTGRR